MAKGSPDWGCLRIYAPRQSNPEIYSRNAAEFGLDDTMVVELRTSGGLQLTRLFSDKGVAKIAMLASTPKAAAFRDWAATVLTTPRELAPLALPAPALPPEVRRALINHYNLRGFLRYAKLGLTGREIGKLLGVSPDSIRKRRRLAESLGLISPPANIGRMRELGDMRFGHVR
jgi:hypothetical protein